MGYLRVGQACYTHFDYTLQSRISVNRTEGKELREAIAKYREAERKYKEAINADNGDN